MRLATAFLCLWSLLAAAFAAAPTSVPPVSPVHENGPFPLHRHTLPNGLRVWCQPRSDSASVAALLVIRAGSRYEDPANNGVSHFVEHMLFTGTERWDEEEVKEVITRRGGRWNGWTDRERSGYYAHVAASDLDVALDWLAQVVFHPTFPPDKVDKEREVIFQERGGHYGELINTLDALGFGYDLDRDVRRALFPGSTLGLRIAGEDASLKSIDRAALLAYYQRHYTPDNAALIVVGNAAPEQVLQQAEAHFGPLARGGRPAPPDTPPLTGTGPHQVIVRGPGFTDQTTLMVGARTVGRAHPDVWTLQVLAQVLDEDLTKDIRYQHGLVYDLGATNVLFDDVGYFAIYTTSAQGNCETIRHTIEEHLARVQRGEVEAERVAEAQVALKGRWALDMEDNVTRAEWLAQWTSVLADDEPVPDYPAAIESVTPVDLTRVVETYFTPPRRYVGLHQPVVTVDSGARVAVVCLGGVAVLGLALWGVRRWRRSNTTSGPT